MNGIARIESLLVISVCALFSVTATADLVKMSASGLCHPPQSSWYERTKNYQAFESIDTCLKAGGKRPKGLAASLESMSQRQPLAKAQEYKRSAFGHGWDDTDGDCQNIRAEALIATSTTPVRFATGKRCRVVTGRWISPFTNRVIQNASDIDIDHVVPLAWSWNRGSAQWAREKRERFANDPLNLWASRSWSESKQGCPGA